MVGRGIALDLVGDEAEELWVEDDVPGGGTRPGWVGYTVGSWLVGMSWSSCLRLICCGREAYRL